MNDVTGGDLYSLWKIANVALPRVAGVYSGGSSSMGSSEGKIKGAFEDGANQHGQPTYGGSMEAFTKVYSEFQHVMAQTAQNLMDTADAVNTAIEEYRDQDGANAGAQLDSILEGEEIDGVQLHDPDDPNQNPPEDPPADPDRPDGYESPGDEKSEDPDAERREINDTLEDLEDLEEK